MGQPVFTCFPHWQISWNTAFSARVHFCKTVLKSHARSSGNHARLRKTGPDTNAWAEAVCCSTSHRILTWKNSACVLSCSKGYTELFSPLSPPPPPPQSFILPTSWFVLSCVVRPAGLEIDTWAGATEGFVATAAAANGNVASDCPGSTVVPGYSVTLRTSLLGPGEQVILWLSEGRWEDVERACWCIVVHVGKQDRGKGDSGGEWKGEGEI